MILLAFLVGFPRVCAEGFFTAQFLGLNNQAADLNDAGQLAGEYRELTPYAQSFDGTRWIQAETNGLEWSAFYGINNHGTVVGARALIVSNAVVVHAIQVRGSEPGRAVNLGSLMGLNGNAKALAINDSGVAVGDSLNADGRRHAVRFETNGVVTDLGVLGGASSSALDINNRGDVVGEWRNANADARGFLFPIDGVMHDIGTLGGSETLVKRMNARGEIVGSSMTSSGEFHAFLYSGGEMKDLGTLGGIESVAYGINDEGVIVGTSTTENGVLAAFIKYPGKPLEDLTTLTAVPDADALALALSINNRGMIIARGFKAGANYLLKSSVLEVHRNNAEVILRYAAPEGTRVRIDTALELTDWTPVVTNTITTTPMLLNRPLAGPARFYRAVIEQQTN